MEAIMQVQNGILTAILFLGYLILWQVKKREMLKSDGIDVNVIYKAQKPVQKYFGTMGKIMTISIVPIIIIHLLFKDSLAATDYIDILDVGQMKLTGFIIGISGLIICRIAQVSIGKSWRVGIDENAKPGLVTNGVYKYVRNPTYTGLYLLCAGVWIINPSFLYSYWILVFFIMMEFQVRCEEEWLGSRYGSEYTEYCKRTKRYIPLIY